MSKKEIVQIFCHKIKDIENIKSNPTRRVALTLLQIELSCKILNRLCLIEG